MNPSLSSTVGLGPMEASAEPAARSAIAWRLGLDWAERVLVGGWFAFFAWRLIPQSGESLVNANWLLIVSESLVIVLLVFRRQATAVSQRPADWLLALGATMLPLSVSQAAHPGQFLSPVVCACIMIAGLLVQIRAKLSLGRSVGMVPANRGIKRGGAYQLVRHPIYAGYLISEMGFLLLHPTIWNASVGCLALILQIFRILAEERFLAQNAEYREYMQHVKYRLIPGIF